MVTVRMAQSNPPGYPLPDGELGEDEIVCQLIFLPDRSEYWQALLGAISYMATWKAWERDSDKRGKDAASNWREAFELTMGCWRMTCLEDLTSTVTDILELLQNKKDCCDDNITYLPVDPIDTDIVPNDGDPPATYGETEVEDWDEWNEHLCYNANKYVDYLAHVGDQLWEATRNSAILIGLIAALLALLAFSGIGLPIAFGLAATIVSGIILTGTSVTFEDTEDDIEAARNEIICAILQGRSLADAVETALDSNAAWTLFFQFIQYDDAIAVMYNGGADGEYLPTETDDTCVCLCKHVYVIDTATPVNIIYQNSSGAQWNFGKSVTPPNVGTQKCQIRFNWDGIERCGPLKVIDTISVDDALLFTRIITYGDFGAIIDDFWDGNPDCDQNINLVQGATVTMLYFERRPIADGGCAQDISTITVTYHDDV